MRYSIFLFFFASSVSAQNLIPNPDFEGFNPCYQNPIYGVDCEIKNPSCTSACCQRFLPYSYYKGGPYNWVQPFDNMVFYFNDCIIDTYQRQWPGEPTPWYQPRSGYSFIVITTFARHFTNFREIRAYAHVKLPEPLTAGCKYLGGLHVKLLTRWSDKSHNNYLWSALRSFYNEAIQSPSDGLGMYFSADSIAEKYDSVLTSLSPQISNPAGRFLRDSMEYMEVSGMFTAQGGEQWLTLGNFKSNADTQTELTGNVCSVYMIDDVWLEEWKPQLMVSTDTVACSNAPLLLRATKGLHNYRWSDGSNADTLVVTTPGWYWITASNGCTVLRDSIHVAFEAPITSPFSLGRDTIVCNVSEGITLTAPSGYNDYRWSTGLSATSIEIKQEGLYYVNATYACGSAYDSIRVSQFHPPAEVLNSKDTSICFGETLDLHPIISLSSPAWNIGSTQSTIQVDTAGTYSISGLYSPGCLVSDQATVEVLFPPDISLGNDEAFCEGLQMIKKVNGNQYDSIEWWDGSTQWEHVFTSTGEYSVKVFNRCFSAVDSVQLTAIDCTPYIPNLVTKNGDGKNDYFQINLQLPRTVLLTIYNRWGDKIYTDKEYMNDWPENITPGLYFYFLEDIQLNKSYKGWVEIKE